MTRHHKSAYFVLAVTLLTLVGCSPQTHVKPVGSDYTLVWHEPTNPDDHPGTTLHYKGKEVWPFVYGGYGCFAQTGMMVFVGLMPEGDGCNPYQQLFAVRGDGPPVVLSQRLLHQELVVSNNEILPFSVQSLEFTNGDFQVQFKQYTNILTRDFTWPDVTGFLDEGDRSARVAHPPFPDYRILR